jgi:hypothetical protein
MIKTKIAALCAAAAAVAAAAPLAAQNLSLAPIAAVGDRPSSAAAAQADQWTWTVAPYLLMPTMQGKSGIGNLPPLSVDASASEIFSHLQFGAMLYAQARKGAWAFALNGIYMDLKQPVNPGGTIVTGSLSMSQGALEGFAFRELSHGFEVTLGGLVNSIKMSADITVLPGPTPNSTSKSQTWGLPLIGFRWTPVDSEKWQLLLFGVFGGVGSDNWGYQVLPSVGYKFSRLFELSLQYQWLGLNYKTGSGSSTYSYDMNIFGPQVAFEFHF